VLPPGTTVEIVGVLQTAPGVFVVDATEADQQLHLELAMLLENESRTPPCCEGWAPLKAAKPQTTLDLAAPAAAAPEPAQSAFAAPAPKSAASDATKKAAFSAPAAAAAAPAFAAAAFPAAAFPAAAPKSAASDVTKKAAFSAPAAAAPAKNPFGFDEPAPKSAASGATMKGTLGAPTGPLLSAASMSADASSASGAPSKPKTSVGLAAAGSEVASAMSRLQVAFPSIACECIAEILGHADGNEAAAQAMLTVPASPPRFGTCEPVD
jgi:hypothetical protein